MRVFCLYPTGWARLTRTKKPVDLEGGGRKRRISDLIYGGVPWLVVWINTTVSLLL